MNCRQCQGIEELFSEVFVANELKRYNHRGPIKTTRILIDALKHAGIDGLTLLDIGGGLGAVQHGLLAAGVTTAIDVEASRAYLVAAKSESMRRGYSERVSFQYGNFIDLAEKIAPADIVTLDRVICCFPEMEKMVEQSVRLAGKLYGLVYPRDTWWVKLAGRLENLAFSVKRSPYRAYIHATKVVEALISARGFKKVFIKRTLAWQVVVFAR